jgi:hypothetical protein
MSAIAPIPDGYDSWSTVPDSRIGSEIQTHRTTLTEADRIWRDPRRRFECAQCGKHYLTRYPGDTGHCNACATALGITSAGRPVGSPAPNEVPRVP